nr:MULTISPECIES: restriction endonuclease subunit S [unclassified Vibrio]
MINKSIPDSWEWASLVNDINYVPTGVPEFQEIKEYFSTGSIDGESYTPEGSYSYSDKPSRANRIGIKGDVFQARMKSTNKSFIVNDALSGALFSTGFFQCRSYAGTIDSKYLSYYFSSRVFGEIKDKLCTGSTQSSLNDKAAINIQIPIPPINEQKRIVERIEELFSELDSGIESLTKAKQQLSVYRQTLLKQAFEGKLTESWRIDNEDKLTPPKELLIQVQKEREKIYQRQLEEWNVEVKLWEDNGEKGKKPTKPKLLKSNSVNTSENGNSKVWYKTSLINILLSKPANGKSVRDLPGGFPVLRLTSLKSKYVDLSESKEGLWTKKDAKPYIIHKGDFLLSRGNGSKRLVGRGALVNEIKFEVAYPDTIVRLSLPKEGIIPELFSYFWNSAVFREQIENSARTTAGIYKINQAVISEYEYPVISLNEQKLILTLLDEKISISEQIENDIETNLIKAELLRQSILKNAFTGKLVAQDSEDEPAIELLKRIAIEKQRIAEKDRTEKAAARKKKSTANKTVKS